MKRILLTALPSLFVAVFVLAAPQISLESIFPQPSFGSLSQPGSGSTDTATAGWTDDGTVVRLNTVTDQVGIGTTTVNSTYKLGVSDGILIGGTATSTFTGNGINLYAGCFAVRGVCVGATSGTVTSVATNNGITGGTITTSGTLSLDTAFAATWTAAQTFNAGATTTNLFSSASSTIGGALNVSGASNLSNGLTVIGSLSLPASSVTNAML